ncbi:MAG: phosphoethanolamine transferase [Tannerella sp.]|nr:phosphoethanolamine transferase [Tannerella sp.]
MARFLKDGRLLFSAIATLFIGLTCTSADFVTIPVASLWDAAVVFAQWAIVMIALFPVIHLITLNRYVFAVFFPIVCLLSGVLTWFRYTTGTVLTTMILDATFDNDIRISAELMSPGLFVIAVASLLAGMLFAFYRFRKFGLNRYLWWHLALAIIWLCGAYSHWKIRLPVAEKIPTNLYFVTSRYLAEKRIYLKTRPPLGENITCGENRPLVIFILGESLRADHLQINGYERNTTPCLAAEDIISFPNIYSEGVITNVSLPTILTRADGIHPERADNERSFVDLFKRCGYHTVWLANQEPADSYVYFMQECDTLIYGNINKSSYVFDCWTDEVLLPDFETFTRNSDTSRLIILHTIGSHWYYNSHYPADFKHFTPITESKIVSSNTREQMVNSYDNTVLYTDFFICNIINRLRAANAIIIYLSDHGEALGEDGRYLHAFDAPAAHNPACFVWMSQQYKVLYPDRYKSLSDNCLRRYDTDFLFHTILESANIQSDVIEPEKSLFNPLIINQ